MIGGSPLPRTEVTKKLWAYIKKNDLQDSKNRRNINADDKLKEVFGGKKTVSMFEMTKLVSRPPQVSFSLLGSAVRAGEAGPDSRVTRCHAAADFITILPRSRELRGSLRLLARFSAVSVVIETLERGEEGKQRVAIGLGQCAEGIA